MPADPSNADILWSAVIDDKTGQFFVSFNNNIDGVTQRGQVAFRNVGDAAKNSGRAIGVVGGIVGSLATEFMRLGRQAVSALTDIAKESVMLAARADTLAIALDTVGRNVGYTSKEIDVLEESVKNNGITTIASRRIMLQMAEANLDLAKAVDLTRVAQDAAVIANINSSEAAQRLIHGITSLNPLVLRHMGLYVDLDEAYKNAVGTSKRIYQELSTREKQQYALNAVIEAGARIEGAYEAAMETAGKQAGSTARFVQELQLEIGRVVQPAFLEFILRFNGLLQDATDYLKDNADSMERLAMFLADATTAALDFGEAFVSSLKDVPGILVEIEAEVLKLLSDMSDDEMEKRLEGMGVAFKQYIALLAGALAATVVLIRTTIQEMIEGFKTLWKTVVLVMDIFRGRDATSGITEVMSGIQDMADILDEWQYEAAAAYDDAVLSVSRYLGLIEDTGDASRDMEGDVIDAFKNIAEETDDLIDKIEELNEKIGKELAEAAIQAQRDAIEEAIRNQQRLEDIARRNAQRIEDIYRRYHRSLADIEGDEQDNEYDAAREAADKREKLARDHAYNLLEIEIEYGRTLEDIRRNFEYDATEAARSNDAVRLAKLMRERARDIEEAGIERGRDIEDEERDYKQRLANLKRDEEKIRAEKKKAADKRLEDLEKQLQRELEDAEIARQRDLENLRISQERERQIKELHRQWDLEDLWRKYEEELQMLGIHAADLSWLTDEMLTNLLMQHGQYITEDLTLWNSYYTRLEQLAAASATALAKLPYPIPEDPYYSDPNAGAGTAEYQSGGIGIATRPTQVTFGEVPELVAAIPLTSMVRYDHNINMSGELNVNGVSPSAEADLVPAIMNVLAQFGRQLVSQSGGIR